MRIKQISANIVGRVRDIIIKSPLKNLPGAKQGYNHIRSTLAPSEPTWVDYNGYELYIDPKDRIGYQIYRGKWEPDVKRTIQQNLPEGGIAVDIGGHFGVFTLLMRGCVGEDGHVLVFEPHPENAEMIRRTIQRNGFDNVELVEAAVGNTTGNTTFKSVEESSLSSTYNDIDLGGSYDQTEIEVDTVTLGDYVESRFHTIDFVKIDIQGAEIHAFRGMKDNIQNIRSILLELHETLSAEEINEIFQLLQPNGELIDIDSGDPIDTIDQFQDSLHILWINKNTIDK